MIRHLVLLAVLAVLLTCLLTLLRPGPSPIVLSHAARAQEPIPLPPPYGPLARDPATVASELLPDPAEPLPPPVERPAPRWASRGYVNDVGGAASQLRGQVTQLKHDITTDLRGDQRRELSRAADDVLDALDTFEARLAPGRPRAAVAEDYAAVAARMSALTNDARAAGLGRAGAGWVTMADERLAEAVSMGEGPAAWDPPLVVRACDNLVFHARDLERQGEFALSAAPGRRTLQQELRDLTAAAEFFRAGVAMGSARDRLMRDFSSVQGVWARVAPAVEELARDERLPIVPRARRVQGEIDNLHRLLGVAGTPARLEPSAEPKQPVRSYGGIYLPASGPW
jgi:hypothetical protein